MAALPVIAPATLSAGLANRAPVLVPLLSAMAVPEVSAKR
jgi:hypothetical protein